MRLETNGHSNRHREVFLDTRRTWLRLERWQAVGTPQSSWHWVRKHIFSPSFFISLPLTNRHCIPLTATHTFPHTHTHFLWVKRQGRDFIASEVMRPPLPHSLQCSTDSPRASFHTFRTLRSVSRLLYTPCIPILPHHFSSLPIFSSSHCPFFLNITLIFVALIWNEFQGDFEDVSNQNKV